MSLMVKKFGGTSVANIERIEAVADQIFEFYRQNKQVVVVVSAMKGDTDKLEKFAYQITDHPDPREMAALLATGEQVAISLLAMALIKRGCPARSYTGLQLGIETTGLATKARINRINTENIYNDLQSGKLVIVAGFQGVNLDGSVTTLGRGGSDTTAVALAIALKAMECHIYTDVDGVYTADPNIVPNAKRLKHIHFSEMLELAGLGAKVMQIRAVELGSYYDMPIRVLSSFNQDEAANTLISAGDFAELGYSQVVKIATLSGQVKIMIRHLTLKNIEFLLQSLANFQIEIDLFSSSIYDGSNNNYSASWIIAKKDLDLCNSILYKILPIPTLTPTVANSGVVDSNVEYLLVSKLSLVGLGLASNPDIISKIYVGLFQANIYIQQIITSETKVSVLLNEKDLELAVKILHAVFLEAAQESVKFKCI